jgi:hypothetical protein
VEQYLRTNRILGYDKVPEPLQQETPDIHSSTKRASELQGGHAEKKKGGKKSEKKVISHNFMIP